MSKALAGSKLVITTNILTLFSMVPDMFFQQPTARPSPAPSKPEIWEPGFRNSESKKKIIKMSTIKTKIHVAQNVRNAYTSRGKNNFPAPFHVASSKKYHGPFCFLLFFLCIFSLVGQWSWGLFFQRPETFNHR